MEADRFLEVAKAEELAAKLRREGFQVEERARLGGEAYDMVATKDGQTLVFQVKSSAKLKDDATYLAKLRENAHAHNANFQLVVVNPPRQVEVYVRDLEGILTRWASENVPEALQELSRSTEVDSVNDVEIDSVRITPNSVVVTGSASISVNLNYGGRGDDAFATSDTFPLEFEAELDGDLNLEQIESFEVDTSSWYE